MTKCKCRLYAYRNVMGIVNEMAIRQLYRCNEKKRIMTLLATQRNVSEAEMRMARCCKKWTRQNALNKSRVAESKPDRYPVFFFCTNT